MFLANRKPRQSREEAIRESMNSPIKLDPTITFSIPRANVQKNININVHAVEKDLII